MSMTDRLRSEDGFTLTELLTAILISTIVLLASMTLLDRSQGATTRVQDRVDATQKGRVAMELITQRLRSQTCLGTGVPALLDARPDQVTFYTEMRDFSSSAGSGFKPELRRLTFASNGSIDEAVWASQASSTAPFFTFPGYAATPTQQLAIARGMQRAGTTPYFRYFAFVGDNPATPSQEVIPAANSSLSADDRARIVRIMVTFDSRPTRTVQSTNVDSTFEAEVYVRTSDPTDPTHSPQCL
jgi:prepilin-type N-terminal cleavage/methylation domain-containing protein